MPTTASPRLAYRLLTSLTQGSVRTQLIQPNVQTSTRTTRPDSSCQVTGPPIHAAGSSVGNGGACGGVSSRGGAAAVIRAARAAQTAKRVGIISGQRTHELFHSRGLTAAEPPGWRYSGKRSRDNGPMGRSTVSALSRALVATWMGAASVGAAEVPDVRLFLEAASTDERVAEASLEKLGRSWTDDHAALIVDLLRFTRGANRPAAGGEEPSFEDAPGNAPTQVPRAEQPSFAPPNPTFAVRQRLIRFLEKQSGQRFGHDLKRWRHWVWNRPYHPHPDYAFFKAALYSAIDRRMAAFFPPDSRALIRLDEIDWGGIVVDGIPPLDHPKVLPAREAGWLKDGHTVFGIVVNGEARAYPKRILGWHELVRDRVGGVELTVVYCTLCGTVIPYGSVAGGRNHTLGTSGLLYRSNKLMYDRETMSLWSTVEGRPVSGPLAGSDLELTAYPVVTTTWEEWRARHPHTTVLSRETGYERDYSEGAAYREYFATDGLMFGVPRADGRLKNKDEVLAVLLRPRDAGPRAERQALALSAAFLRKNPVFPVTFAGHELVALTSPDGANRLYISDGVVFRRLTSDLTVEDAQGRLWRIEETALRLESDSTTSLPRVPARRAFWFGWHAQFPETELIK
jgi:hypothetical protein